MFEIYMIKKFALSAFFSFFSTKYLLAVTTTSTISNNSPIKLEEILSDYLFLMFLFFGLVISLLHESYNTKKDYKFGVGIVILSIFTTIVSTLFIWVLYKQDTIPEKGYYGAVLFSAVFSSGIVRYLLVHLPDRLGGNLLKLVDRIGTIKSDKT